MSRTPRSAAELVARLARLRSACQGLRLHAQLGGELREALSETGSLTWAPAEDLSWRRWIEHHGDEYAQLLLAAFDAELEARAAQMKAKGEPRARPQTPATHV